MENFDCKAPGAQDDVEFKYYCTAEDAIDRKSAYDPMLYDPNRPGVDLWPLPVSTQHDKYFDENLLGTDTPKYSAKPATIMCTGEIANPEADRENQYRSSCWVQADPSDLPHISGASFGSVDSINHFRRSPKPHWLCCQHMAH